MNAETNRTRTIVVPCYNEAERLDTERFRQFVDGGLTRFLFVNDGSSDATASVCSRWSATSERPRLSGSACSSP